MKNSKINIGFEVAKQLDFITSSCQLYDIGRFEEALRIAVAVRTLFHNTKNSKGIIGGHFDAMGLRLLSTTMFNPSGPIKESNFLGFIGLYPSIGGFKPILNDGKRKEEISWEDWWEKEPIMAIAKTQESITRKRLILACANKDGGAHVDEVKPKEYEKLDKGLGLAVVAKFANGITRKVELKHANLSALRQIGYEILMSKDMQRLAESA